MNYEDAINYLSNDFKHNEKKGLVTLKKFLDVMGHPEKKLKIIHIAGTNGKGSTSSMLNYILLEQGYNVGLFTSPHIRKYNERLQINNKSISNEDFILEIENIKNISKIVFGNDFDKISFFEMLTLICFNYFSKKDLDFIILEAGIGGKFDSTNSIENPILTILTSISIDHVGLLGDTIEQISYEKAGIIKNSTPLVLYSQIKEVYNIMEQETTKHNSKLYYLNTDLEIEILEQNINFSSFSIKHSDFQYENLILNLIGRHQIYNSANCLLAIKALNDLGYFVSENSIREGLKKVSWPCRMELLNYKDRTILLDGAHNLDGILKFIESSNTYFKDNNKILLTGFLSDKEYFKMATELFTITDKIIVTNINNHRTIESDELFNKFNKNILTTKNPFDGLEKAIETSTANDIILVTGSLYLVGDIRNYIIKED